MGVGVTRIPLLVKRLLRASEPWSVSPQEDGVRGTQEGEQKPHIVGPRAEGLGYVLGVKARWLREGGGADH